MLVELLLATGIRIGSALALDVEDLDFGHGEMALRRAKNDRPATGIMPVAVAEKLRAFVGDRAAGPVFVARCRRISTRHCQRRLTTSGVFSVIRRGGYSLYLPGTSGDVFLVLVGSRRIYLVGMVLGFVHPRPELLPLLILLVFAEGTRGAVS